VHVHIHWVDVGSPGRLGLMPRPAGHELLEECLTEMSRLGVTSVVSMLEADEARLLGLEREEATCGALGMSFASLPVRDFSIPRSEPAFWAAAAAIDAEVQAGRGVVVHCMAGIGRSGMLTSAVLVLGGFEPEEALARVSRARGRPVPETADQRAWFLEVARRRQSSTQAPDRLS
jgi:protein-tyrosine phosphatase